MRFPLPEMTFGNNYLSLEHRTSGWRMMLDAMEGNELLEGDGGVKVGLGFADAWLPKSRTDSGTSLPLPTTVTAKSYDWTLLQQGQIRADPENRQDQLTRPDPTLLYAEVPLFEDKLHDNGSSNLLVRIRVMPTCIFILSRFTLRVDNVLFRTHDTRMFHSFTSNPPLVVRQVSGWEAPYNRVKRQLPRHDDLTPLTDANFIAKILTAMPTETSQMITGGTQWRGLRTKVEVSLVTRVGPYYEASR
ncbi:hypothetical protein PAXINDRAFT_173160 [Paxillus involutus ATCC 200175]|uniref:Type 2A phosphatase activator TIP41 n=1 Tax=Paxillus involutus ATCC 200175 TaxID=664439 RepID=A0A0C9TKS0_PAXIN|nr:hypothetical protein PAXINDRAFT_173160 [Paxillus involutus ATCC 200175]